MNVLLNAFWLCCTKCMTLCYSMFLFIFDEVYVLLIMFYVFCRKCMFYVKLFGYFAINACFTESGLVVV